VDKCTYGVKHWRHAAIAQQHNKNKSKMKRIDVVVGVPTGLNTGDMRVLRPIAIMRAS
jgi:hypothetical protein